MIVLRASLLHRSIAAKVCRTFATDGFKGPYWHDRFPDKMVRSFDEIPTVEEPLTNPYLIHEVVPQWFKKYGWVVKEPKGDGSYCVHTFHFDDFETIYKDDHKYYRKTRKPPVRQSHQIIKRYREDNRHLYDNCGLGPGDGDYVGRIRDLIRGSLKTGADEKLEQVADDLIELLRSKVGESAKIELLPWLFRWSFENIGLKFLDKRLGALCPDGNEEADKMVQAAAVINEMVFLTTLDPDTDFAERYDKLAAAESYFYRVVKKYVHEIAFQPESDCAVKKIWNRNPKDAITVTLDGFQGALPTVPLTVLMALYNLARNKDIQIEAREELIDVLPTKDSKYSTSYVTPMILKYIVWETLRFSPPIIGNGRFIKNDLVIGGYLVPKETNVIMHFQVASRLEEFYDDPLKFNPWRFNRANPERVKKVFGDGGWRSCIGSSFALDTIPLIIMKMLRNFDISYEGEEIVMINRLHNEPKEPLILKLTPLTE